MDSEFPHQTVSPLKAKTGSTSVTILPWELSSVQDREAEETNEWGTLVGAGF